MGDPNDEAKHNAHIDELREKVFQGLESFVVRCPSEMAGFVEQVVKACKAFCVYDPNFNDIEEDEDGDDDADDDGYSDEDIGDDDDSSWKVRRVAAKVLGSVVATRPDLLDSFYNEFADLLIARFRERIESVRLEIMNTFMGMLSGAGVSHSLTTTRYFFFLL